MNIIIATFLWIKDFLAGCADTVFNHSLIHVFSFELQPKQGYSCLKGFAIKVQNIDAWDNRDVFENKLNTVGLPYVIWSLGN